MKKRLLPFALGALLAAAGYGAYTMWPEPTVVLATYRFTWNDQVYQTHALHCGMVDGAFHFQALDEPKGDVYIAVSNLVFAACLDNEMTNVMRLD